ncbi:lipopolysaccharide biosynthesis protein [Azonexus sp. IMCC34839]|uniref:lipopolysaccharide biosynthesis protein n=1 Tax=Azonexus sp. IMCC34839 TaxID=3133695 RepID=UPI00399B6197
MSVKSRAIRNTAIVSGANLLVLLIGFLLLPVLVYRIGADGYGYLAYARMFSSMGVLAIFDLGLRMAVTRSVADYHVRGDFEKIKTLLLSTAWLLAAIGVSFAVLGWQFSQEIARALVSSDDDIETMALAIKWAFATWPLELPGMVVYGALEGLQRFRQVKVLEILWYLLYTALAIAAVSVGYDYVVVAAIALVLLLMKLGLATNILLNCLPKTSLSWFRLPDAAVLTRQMKLGKHIFLSQLSSMIANQGEKLAVAILLPPAMMTGYEVLIKLPRMIKSNFALGNQVVMPLASELSASDDMERNRKLLDYGMQFNLAVVVPISVTSAYLASPFLNAWMGADFTYLTPLLQVLLIFNIINPLSSFGWQIMIGMNRKVHHVSMIQWLNLAVTLLIWLAFIPNYGLWGVVAAFFSIVITIPWSIRVPCCELGLPVGGVVGMFVRMVVLSIIPVAVLELIGIHDIGNAVLMLALEGVICGLAAWLLIYRWGLTEQARALVRGQLHKLKRWQK